MRFQILSLSGGGYGGLFTISILSEIERLTGRPVASTFDLLAGTSIGGIIALGLANRHSAIEIKEIFQEFGPRIFSSRDRSKSPTSTVFDLVSCAFSSKYSGVELRTAVERICGPNTCMGDLKHPVIVPTVNLSKGSPQVFKTDHHPDFRSDLSKRVVDVAMATSAAPVYFPIAEIGDELFVDGGIFANSPDLIALHEAEHFLDVPLGEIHMLSIGTTTTQYSISHSTRRNIGVIGWLSRLAPTVISSQQMDVKYILEHKLKDQYKRVDCILSSEQEAIVGLDSASKSAEKTLRALANGEFQSLLNDEKFKLMIDHTPRSPVFFHR